LPSCDNLIYLKNLIESLEDAKIRKDVERIVIFASEMERFKILCGNSPVIQQFEASVRRVSEELGLTNHPTIERAMNAHPEHMCQCRTCEQSPPTQRQMGFRAMLDASAGVIERSVEEEEHPNIERGRAVGFSAMLDAAARGENSGEAPERDESRPIVRGYGMGFKAMLEGAANGTIEERSFQDVEEPNPPVRRDGFVGQLEDAYGGTPERRVIMRMARR